MPDSDVQITAGTGTKIDTRTVGSGSDEHRQVVVIGDPTTAGNVVGVDANGDIGVVVNNTSIAVTQGSVLTWPVQLSDFDSNPLNEIRKFETASTAPHTGALASLAPDARFSSVSLGTALNSTQSWQAASMSEFVVYVGTTTSGTMTFEVSPDGTNWVQALTLDELTGLYVTGVTPTSGKVYRVDTHAYRTLRARTSAALGATVSLIATGTSSSSIVGVSLAPAPHNMGYSIVNKTIQQTSATTTTVWDPPAGKRLAIVSLQIQAGGTTAGAVQVFFGSGSYVRGTNYALFDGEFAPSANSKPGVVITPVIPFVSVTADTDLLRVTAAAAINPLTVSAWGYEF